MKKNFFITFIFLIVCFNNSNAQNLNGEHLEPLSGILNEYDFMTEYSFKIKKQLLDRINLTQNGYGHYIRLLTVPSFKPENVLMIKGHKIVFAELKKNIYNSKNVFKIPFKSYISDISDNDLELIGELFYTAIKQTKYSEKENFGTDGTTYYFNFQGKISGKIWSPDSGTKIYKLIKICNEIIKIVKSQSFRIDDKLKHRINKLIAEIRTKKLFVNNELFKYYFTFEFENNKSNPNREVNMILNLHFSDSLGKKYKIKFTCYDDIIQMNGGLRSHLYFKYPYYGLGLNEPILINKIIKKALLDMKKDSSMELTNGLSLLKNLGIKTQKYE